MKRTGTAIAVASCLLAAAGCSSSKSAASQRVGAVTSSTPGLPSRPQSPPAAPSTTQPSTPTPSLTAAFAAAAVAAAFLKPADLGTGWRDANAGSDTTWNRQYAWGCDDDSAQIHQIGNLPTKRVSLRDDWDSYIEQSILFPDEAKAQAAQAALEKQPRACTGTHRAPGIGGGEATNDSVDFTQVNKSGFEGTAYHIAAVGVENGVNESVYIEVRRGPLLVFVYYNLAAQQDPSPTARHAKFVAASDAAIGKALQALAGAAR